MKQEYLHSRNNNQIHLGLVWEFYIETKHERPKIPYQMFEQLFQVWANNFQPSLERYFIHFDTKFDIMKLTLKTGQTKYI